MNFDGGFGDAVLAGDFLVAGTAHEAAQHVQFARREAGDGVVDGLLFGGAVVCAGFCWRLERRDSELTP